MATYGNPTMPKKKKIALKIKEPTSKMPSRKL